MSEWFNNYATDHLNESNDPWRFVPASDIDMTWARVLFVIEGIAVSENALAHVGHNRFPNERLPLPYLLDVMTLQPFLEPSRDGQDDM